MMAFAMFAAGALTVIFIFAPAVHNDDEPDGNA